MGNHLTAGFFNQPFHIIILVIEYAREELLDAERQIESTIHKLEATVITFESKDNVSRCKSQITLAKAFTIALELIREKLHGI